LYALTVPCGAVGAGPLVMAIYNHGYAECQGGIVTDFPHHDPNGPDVDPITSDERETSGPTSADLRRLEGET